MDNWEDYIINKFVPPDQFSFQTYEEESGVTVTHTITGTMFCFYTTPGKEWKELSDVQFYNKKTRGWSGEYGEIVLFSHAEAKHVDNFLSPAFDTGWISMDTYLFGSHWKSQVYFNLDKTGIPFGYFSSELGCLSLILFPVFSLLALLFGRTETVSIEPVKKHLGQE